jgi:hypothetical protein
MEAVFLRCLIKNGAEDDVSSALLKKEKNSLVAGGRFELPTFGL